MFWRYKPPHYQICIPPLQKPFYELIHEETETYFQRHLAHLRERIDYLSGTVSRADPFGPSRRRPLHIYIGLCDTPA